MNECAGGAIAVTRSSDGSEEGSIYSVMSRHGIFGPFASDLRFGFGMMMGDFEGTTDGVREISQFPFPYPFP